MAGLLRVGDKAPDFTLQSQDGRMVSLRDYAGSKNVVIYFYPKDFTIGCTAETKSFSDNYEDVLRLGAEVIGISSDSAESHENFAEKCGAKFPLLADRGGKVRELYGAKGTFGITPGRVTFVIDKQGIIRHVYSSQLRPKQHIPEAVEALKAMSD